MWNVFADQIHVVPDPSVPLSALAVVVALLVATALAVSIRPAVQAARTTPVRWLRAE
jgi:ABC-type lipoprotein release transport system permease subunit